MSLGPLTTTFTPPATCTASFADFYQQPAVGGDYAGPLRTSDCFPPNYASARTAFFSPASICPYGFVSACGRVTTTAESAAPETIITCCPSIQGGKGFTCNPDTLPAHAETLVCKSAFLSGASFQNHISVTVNGGSIQTLSAVTTGYTANYNGALNAFGVQLRYRNEDDKSSTATPTGSDPGSSTSQTSNDKTPNETDASSGPGSTSAAASTKEGVSTNTIVGAAVGGSIGMLLIIVMIAGIIVLRKKRGHKPGAQELEGSSAPGQPPSVYWDNPGEAEVKAHKAYVSETAAHYQYTVPAEMPTNTPTPEAPGDSSWQPNRMSEVPGDNTWRPSQRQHGPTY